MSWSGNTIATRNGVSRESIQTGPSYDDADPQVKEQIDAAAEAANLLITSGCLGGEGKTFSVSVSGHANSGHEPTPGRSNDCVTVSISQRSE